MEQEKVIISTFVSDDLLELVEILYYEEYFGFKESALDYVDKIYDFMYTIPKQIQKQNKNTKYGSYYCRYKHSHHTTWLIFFDKKDANYLIKNITNNHHKNYITFMEI